MVSALFRGNFCECASCLVYIPKNPGQGLEISACLHVCGCSCVCGAKELMTETMLFGSVKQNSNPQETKVQREELLS